MLEGDGFEAARRASAMYPRDGVVQFYDSRRSVGWAYTRGPFEGAHQAAIDGLPDDHWLKQHLENREEGPAWDAYFVYAPGVRWKDGPPAPGAWIKQVGMDERGTSWFWEDTWAVPPRAGDLADAIEAMVSAVVERSASPGAAEATGRIELLGFHGCPYLPGMRENLKTAIARLGGGLSFDQIDQEGLPPSDIRRDYPAPTILVDGRDLFGMERPTARAQSCRVYHGGSPTAEEIAERLEQMRPRLSAADGEDNPPVTAPRGARGTSRSP